MNKRKVIDLLTPKAKALGYSRKELSNVADIILESLPEDMDEADEENEVSRKIDEYLPFLKVGQSAVTRIAEKARTRSAKDDDFADAPRWARRLAKMFEQGSDSTVKRRAKVEALVEDMGKMGKHYLRDFDRHTFRSNEEWEDYFADLKEEIHEVIMERNDEGLSTLTRPVGATEGRRMRRKGDDEIMSDEDVIKLAKGEDF